MEKTITLGDEAIGNEVVVKRPSNYYQLLLEKSRPSCWNDKNIVVQKC